MPVLLHAEWVSAPLGLRTNQFTVTKTGRLSHFVNPNFSSPQPRPPNSLPFTSQNSSRRCSVVPTDPRWAQGRLARLFKIAGDPDGSAPSRISLTPWYNHRMVSRRRLIADVAAVLGIGILCLPLFFQILPPLELSPNTTHMTRRLCPNTLFEDYRLALSVLEQSGSVDGSNLAPATCGIPLARGVLH